MTRSDTPAGRRASEDTGQRVIRIHLGADAVAELRRPNNSIP